MTIRAFENKMPQISLGAYVDELAAVIGDVVLGDDSSVWPMAVIRGDTNLIRIGERTSIQDGSVIHVNHRGEFNLKGSPTFMGNDITVGHRVVLHGCTIEDRCLIGIGSVVMDDVIIHSDTIIGAASLIPPNKELEGGYLWMGTPAKKIRPLTADEKKLLLYSANYYVQLKNKYLG